MNVAKRNKLCNVMMLDATFSMQVMPMFNDKDMKYIKSSRGW